MAKIVIDAGHGGYDAGAVNGERYEKNDNLRIALAVGELLRRCGQTVIYTRDDDTYESLAERVRIANDANADLFVSFHRNSTTNNTANGFENYNAPNASARSKQIARDVYDAVANAGIFLVNRGQKEANYYVIRNTKMPAMLLELGFITSDLDNNSFDTKFTLLADTIASAICKEFASTPTPTPTPTQKDKIIAIQKTLNDVYNQNLTVDGVVGPATRKSLLRALQMQIGVFADGVWGPITKRNIPLVRTGDRGNLVYLIQAALILHGYNITADGVFGAATKNALTEFQRRNGLSPDGIFGANTAEKLF
ncbi:MAG: N-acetylmuramoyl-L-alanine amidase [Christensenellaceae bacterium]|jgi:N-acetylmuramoyl-L-alanine amidase|nr:N-acetylmuramoyl-L-alanine amidase [Christensenellaceae bacterium]